MKKHIKLITEFKEFISRGSVIDLAVGVIMGTSFTAIVNSLVKDIIMPTAGVLMGGVDFTTLRLVVKPATAQTEEVAILYGNFIQSIVNFLIVAFVVFMIIKAINLLHRRQKEEKEQAPKEPAPEIQLLTEIRDLLKKENAQ